ncbi:hypothetical protein OG875_01760 [Streptomyces sp. NBC_01498]|uniref:hypothetical protein n=1 Tax=Streptomyces sp. NBC_01498 TaxID=2975870 RepID=UPI002E7C3EF6|nr:hypothetical protein [Streptomyces sp. NBC_01498]WTL23438.1 hypothetical protein OG875_01760 [Streptomyces sp. NBC_01498]
MTVLLWILGILAAPPLIFALWLVWVFFKELFFAGHDVGNAAGRKAAEKLGLLPAGQLDAESPGPLPAEWRAALAKAREGEWQTPAALLRGIGRDWGRRYLAVSCLGDLVAEDDAWLVAWETACPGDPDAAVVRAQGTVRLAWRRRGGKRAKYTSGKQFDGFHRTLVRARDEIAKAAELNPDDPTPHAVEIWVALGLGYPRATMATLWAQTVARDPYHYGAHFAALQYWCEKWRGSERLAMDFAERAAAGAPPGSLLTALPLIAQFEHKESEDKDADNTPEMVARVDAGLIDAAAADPANPALPELRHLLAFYLSRQDRHEMAIEQFRLVDGYVGALPWFYYAKGTRAAYYCRARNASASAAAAAKVEG